MMSVPYVNIAEQHARIKEELLAAMGRVIDHGQFVLGPEVSEFENKFAKLCGANYAVGVNSGTDALVFALKALGIGEGDEVITVSSSFVASSSCIILAGAQPVFVDVRDDYNIDPTLIEEAITPRTKAILPVHLTGRPADMGPIMELALAHNLYVIEDCAQAVCAEYNERPVGSLGTIGCFSFHPLKTLNACGDGGAITTNNANVYQEVLNLRNIGLQTRDECVVWSHNSRLDTLQAAILMVKLDFLHEWTERRRANAQMYQTSLAGIPRLRVPKDQPFEHAVYHTFVVEAERRDALREYLSTRGIGTAVHYPIPIHLQKVAESLGYGKGSFPVTERLAKRIVSLPVYPELESDQLEYVVDSIRTFYTEDIQ
jgi:dTDP-4-amino-4,6-dideoxygalactose transaminase